MSQADEASAGADVFERPSFIEVMNTMQFHSAKGKTQCCPCV